MGPRLMTILLADDSATSRMACRLVLVRAGHRVIEVATGREAVTRFRQDSPDLVILDVEMPDMDGLTALKEIRLLDPNAKVVMLTALGQQAIIRSAEHAGARDVLFKPVRADDLIERVAKLLS